MQGSTSTIVGAGYGLAGAVRLARAHPVAAGVAVAAASVSAYRNRSRLSSDTRAKLVRFGTEAFKILGEPFVQHEVHGRDWTQAQRGTAGDDVLSQVVRLLARAPEPMTRTDILAALPASVREPHRRQITGWGGSCTASPPSIRQHPADGSSAGTTCRSPHRPGHSGGTSDTKRVRRRQHCSCEYRHRSPPTLLRSAHDQ